VSLPDSGSVPWQSVVMGGNVAYSKDPEAPPPYGADKDKKRDPEYDYIDNQRELMATSSTKL